MRLSTSFFRSCSAVAILALSACGFNDVRKTDAELEFVQATPKSAYLETRDLEDTFVFGMNVVEVKDFFTTAYNLNIRPIKTRLVLQKEGLKQKLYIVDDSEGVTQPEALLSFDAKESNGKIEVDFGSAGNDIAMWNGVGAMFSTQDSTVAPWKTMGLPKVSMVEQGPDFVVADIIHKVGFTWPTEPMDGARSRTGYVKIRIYLERQTATTTNAPTVGDARSHNIGFFGADRGQTDDSIYPIGRFKVDAVSKKEGQIVVYLKDFPAQFEKVAERALLAWNVAFGFKAIKVLPAPEGVDIGDPRYHVVRWFDGLEDEVPWAGYAPTNLDPVTGEVVNAQIFINGSTTVEGFKAMIAYTEKAAQGFNTLQGTVGNIPVVQGAGETPIVTFFSDPSMNEKDFLEGYYFGVIMHEFGHALGLRHNFAASTKLDGNVPSSVMDYEPNWSSARRTEVGSYDKAAIRYGYLGEVPAADSLAFCTDEDMTKRVDCNQGDFGNPSDFVVATLLSGTAVLSNKAVALPSEGSLPMRGAISLAFKMKSLISQFGANATFVDGELSRALKAITTAKAASGLSSSDKFIVEKNLSRLKASYSSVYEAFSSPVASNFGH